MYGLVRVWARSVRVLVRVGVLISISELEAKRYVTYLAETAIQTSWSLGQYLELHCHDEVVSKEEQTPKTEGVADKELIHTVICTRPVSE